MHRIPEVFSEVSAKTARDSVSLPKPILFKSGTEERGPIITGINLIKFVSYFDDFLCTGRRNDMSPIIGSYAESSLLFILVIACAYLG